MDVVNINDFLNVFHVFGSLKQDLDFAWMLWIRMTSFSCIWLWKTIFRFSMDVVDNNDFDFFMYLIVGNNIWILHGCCE